MLPLAAAKEHNPPLEPEELRILLSLGGLQSVGAMEPSIRKSPAVRAVHGQRVASTVIWNVWPGLESAGVWSRVSNRT